MDERLVVVMGATGSGKSRLIKLATGDSTAVVGHTLKSETESITSHPFETLGVHITLIDTPGFDDTYLFDSDVLKSVSEWLTSSYRRGTRISAVVYVYRISDPRMQGSALRNFRIFRELCGEDCFAHITLCTTFWDLYERNRSIPNARLEELKSPEFWGDMIQKGSKISKAPTEMQAARLFFLSTTRTDPLVMQVQREVVDEGKSLAKTSAMLSFLDLELERQRKEHEAAMQEARARWQKEMAAKEAQRNEELEVMRKEFEARLEKQHTATEEVELAIQRQMSKQTSQKSQLLEQMEQLQLQRVKTEADAKFQDAIAARQQKFDQFNDAVIAVFANMHSICVTVAHFEEDTVQGMGEDTRGHRTY